jgi:sugar phosphate isomerase/epimerase
MVESNVKFSVCEFTTPDLTFEEDLELYASIGATGISICEVKLRAGEEDQQLAVFRTSGLQAAVCIPINIGVLNCEPIFSGPEDLDDRLTAMCGSIERLAAFAPASVVVITGSPRGHTNAEARRLVVEGLRTAARRAAAFGVRLSIEPLRTDAGLDLTIVSTIDETLSLIEEIGEPNVDIAYDVYHLWDTPNIVALTQDHAGAFGGVHVCDWREPPRSVGDRLVPGDGAIDLPVLFGALEHGGFDGWYDLEIFSDKELPDSLWAIPPRELVESGRVGFERAWTSRQTPVDRFEREQSS